jgi:ribokinase
MYDVITVGSATVDVFVDTTSELITIKSVNSKNNVIQEEELLAYPAGAKILIKHLDFQTGGGGTNTAVALRKLGLKVGYIGKLGRDDGGKKILALLKKDKIDFLGTSAEGMTGYSIILDSIEQDRTILAYKGIIDTLTLKDIRLSKLKTRWLYFSALVDNSYKVLEYLADYAKRNNIMLAFNPSSYLAEKGSRYLSKALRNTNLLILNKEEAEFIAGKGSIKDLLCTLATFGPKIIVITNGKEGAYSYDGKTTLFIKAHKVKVIETTGAGDAFAASFLCGLIKKNDIRFALQLGIANSEAVISGRGAKVNLLNYPKILEMIKKNPARISRI